MVGVLSYVLGISDFPVQDRVYLQPEFWKR